MSFDAGSIVASMDIDRTAFKQALAEAKAEAEKGVKVRVTADSSQLKAEGDKAGQELGRAIDQGTKKGLSSGGTSAHGGGSWIATAIGLGAPLAGPLAVAGLGFAAFGGLAVKSVLPITKAISGPGGVAGAWGTLDNRQRVAVQSTRALGQEYGKLAKALEPQVFQTYNTALSFGNQLLDRAAPLAHNAAIGIEQFLVQFQNRSGLNQFVTFASGQAIPVIGAIGTTLTQTVHLALNLAKSLTPLGISELGILNNVLKFADDAVTALNHVNPALVPILGGIGQILLISSKLNNISLFSKLFSGVGSITGFSKVFSSISGSVEKTAAKTAAFAIGIDGTVTALKDMTVAERGVAAASAAVDAVNPLGWAVLIGGALIGTIALLSRFKTQADVVTQTLTDQNHAVGFNVEGYYRASSAIGIWNDNNDRLQRTLYNVRTGEVTGTISAGQLSGATQQLTDAQQHLIDQGNNLDSFLNQLQQRYGLTRTQAIQMAQAAGVQASKVTEGGQAMKDAIQIADAYGDSNRKARQPVNALRSDMQGFANTTLTLTTRITDLNNALNAFFNPAVQADQDTIQLKNDQVALAKALAASAGKTGLVTQAQRDARGAFDTYIQQVSQTATDAFKASGNTADYNRVIRNSLPGLEAAAGHNRTLRHEVQLLENTLKAQTPEILKITVKGSGSWVVSPGGSLPGGGGRHITNAGGGVMPGYAPGKDILTTDISPGEGILVPEAVRAIGADTVLGLNAKYGRRNSSGYAGGGVVGSTSTSSIPGLGRWEEGENRATVVAIASSVAKATAAGIAQAVAGIGSSVGGGVPGPGGGAPAANAALARRLYPAWGSGAEWTSWNALTMGESGWNNTITNGGRPYNPTTVAYGIPQALPASKMGAAANPPSSNPTAQIRWMISYLKSSYGDPINAYRQWLSRSPHWYAKGTGQSGAEPGWAWVGENGRELVDFYGGETVLSHQDSMMASSVSSGYASGTKKKDDPQRQHWLAELAQDVKKLDYDETKARKSRSSYRHSLEMDQLWFLEHPGVHKGSIAWNEHQSVMRADRLALTRFNKQENAKEQKLKKEIALLRDLTGYPISKKYGGPGGGPGDGSGDGGAGDGGGDTGGGGAGGGGPTGQAGPTPAWLLPYAGGVGGNGNGGFSQSDSDSGFGGTTSTGGGTSGISSGVTLPFAGMLGNNASTEAQLLAALLGKHMELIEIMRKNPQQTAGGVSEAITGITSAARMRTGRG